MNPFAKLFCRVYQAVLKSVIPILPRRSPVPVLMNATELEQFYDHVMEVSK